MGGIAIPLLVILSACGSAGPGGSASDPAVSSASSLASASAVGSGAALVSPDDSQPPASDDPRESLAPFSCALPVHAAATTPRAQITDLRVATHDAFDRIVIEFAAGLPEYTVESATPPLTQDASGQPIVVEGTSFLRIVLHGGTAQLPAGGTSYGGARTMTPHFPRLVDLKAAGDFEAVSTWYVGMSGSACTRVFTLDQPSRLVIDLQH
jgi:hypothetical protein